MKVSYNWLKEYLDFDLSPTELATILTDTGLEVEGLESHEAVKGGLEGVVIGEVISKEKHPDADRLNVTTVNVGETELLQIVCGAPNVEVGQKVPVATVGTTLYPNPEEAFKIKKSKIRGVESMGMICAEDELGIGTSHDGIMVLDGSAKIGSKASDYFNLKGDTMIEIGLTPNRTDGMSHIGVARDIKAFLNVHRNLDLSLSSGDDTIPHAGNERINLLVEDTEGAPRYAGAVITGIKIEPSPEWLQTRLRSIGLNPINNVVDITNFVMHECGNPLHAFDLSRVAGTINVRRAKAGEKLTTLDEVERQLSTEDLVICNASEPMCLAGVFGGLHSGVSNDTTSLFLEAAYFNPVTVRKSAKRHGLNTDSSFRFERGTDIDNIISARDRAIHLILEIAGGTLGELYDHYPVAAERNQVDLDFNYCRSLTGVDITNDEIEKILLELDFETVTKSNTSIKLYVPTYRVDVTRPADVVEEVLRIYGYNQVPEPAKLNTSITHRQKPNPEKIYNVVANYLTDKGFFEIMNNSLTSGSTWEKIKSNNYSVDHDVRILNPLSNELDVMRQTLIFGGLHAIEHNQNRQHPDLKLYEFGSTYQINEGKFQENRRLCIWVTGRIESENWSAKPENSSYYDVQGILESILIKLGIDKKLTYGNIDSDLFQHGQTISVVNKAIGSIGVVRKDILKSFDIRNEVYVVDLDWDMILSLAHLNKILFKAVPKTQFVRRDFSLLLSDGVQFGEIRKIALSIDNKILRKVGLFDVYEGKNLDKGKKSYAVSFIFQDDEKTLKDVQIDSIMDRIREKLEKDLGAELR